jgi:hypothetical protein
MNVIESVRDNRTGEVRETEWGVSTTDLNLMLTVGNIISHQRAREAGEVHAFQGRLTTTEIRIVL